MATADSEAAGRMDLLTVVLHELGHVLGLGHGDEGTLMDDTLSVGTRRVWEDLDWLEDDWDDI
jgi:predicted Zn-dependent protease